MVPFLISNVLLNKSSTCVNQQMLSNLLITFSIVFIIKLVLLVWFSVAHATSAMLVDKNRTIFLH